MACFQMHQACKVCGETHDFFLCEDELRTDQRYEYQCPGTQQTAYLWDITRVEAVSEPPPNGVELRPTGVESGRRKSSS